MKILLVTPMPPRADAAGAIPLVLRAQVAGLLERHELTLVTVAGDEAGEAEAAEELGRSGLDVHVVDRRQPRGLPRWRRRCRLATAWARGPYPWRTIWFADPRVQATLDRLARTRKFDVAAVEDNAMGIFRFPPHLPTVLTEHEVRRPRAVDWRCGPPANWRRWAFREVNWNRWPAYERSVWRRFDRIQVFTERDARAIEAIAPDLGSRVRVTPFGIELPTAVDPAREEAGLLLFVGNFRHPPNVDAALWLVHEVMPRLRVLAPRARLQLVGGGLPAEVRALEGSDVQVLGEVPTVSPYLEAAAVVLAPVRIGGGMRMKVLHALASGKAVVTTPRGAEGLVLDGLARPVMLAEDADGIASAAATLLADDELRRTLGRRARLFAREHHSVQAYARRLEAVYEEAVAGRAGSPLIAARGD